MPFPRVLLAAAVASRLRMLGRRARRPPAFRRRLPAAWPAAALVLTSLAPTPALAAAGWRRPVDGPVLGRFAYSAARPFAAGQRRGVDFAAAPGEPVRSPCAGRVAFAGTVPRRGLGVTLRCGPLAATVLGLSTPAVHRGDLVFPGQPLGAARGGVPLRLGARRLGRRSGYLDPLPLLRDVPPARPPLLVAPPPARSPRPPGTAPVRAARRPLTASRPAPAHAGAPLAAWLGAALVALGLTAGIAIPRIRRRTRLAAAPER